MKNVFIDTNIWLSLYHFTNDDLSQFEKLKKMIGDSINLIVPQQVYDEIIRNREVKILDALNNFKINRPSYPTFCKGYEEFEKLNSDISSVVNRFEAFKKKIKSQIKTKELPADKILHIFFSDIEKNPCESYIEKAYNRYRIGNPPGKDNKYGDAINWECLLDIIPEGKDLYFISADKDYRSLVSDGDMNPFLVHEWTKKKKSNIYFYSNLVSFLKEHVTEIQLQDEINKEQLIEDLYNSSNYKDTHGIIACLKNYSGWGKAQVEKLCEALETNPQVNRILTDSDVWDFYLTLLSNLKTEVTLDSAIQKAIDMLEEANHHLYEEMKSYHKAEIADALEANYK